MERKKYSLVSNLTFYYRKLYEYAPAVVWKQMLYIICSVMLPLFTIYLPKLMIDFVQRKVSGTMLVGGLGGFILLAAFFSGISQWAGQGTYLERLYSRMRLLCELFRKFLHVDYRYTEDSTYRKKYYSAVQTNYGGDDSVAMRFWMIMPELLIQFFCFVLYSMVIVRMHPFIFLILLGMSVINYLLGEKQRHYRDRMQGNMDDFYRKFGEMESQSRNTAAAKDIRIFGLEGWIVDKMDHLVEQKKELDRRLGIRSLWRTDVGCGLNAVRDFTAYVWLVTDITSGRIGVGDFVLYLGAIQGFGNFLNQMIDWLQVLLEASDRACRYREYYDLQDEELMEGENLVTDAFRFGPLSIDFEDVSFGYEEGKDVLSHFTLHIEPGERVALVGENGAGKTTFVKLLAGFYEPREGKIKINGVDVKKIAKKERYHLFSAVFQENKSFPFTVGENLTLQPQKKIDIARAQEALSRAGIWETFQRKGIGLESYMTKQFLEDGVVLSGGQQQRFMLARALYQNAPVLLLDEPTAALDPIAESEIYDAYAQMTAGKTAVFISHRLASTRFSDKIILLENGKIIESGTHEQLMKAQGTYAAMFNLQASYYQSDTGK